MANIETIIQAVVANPGTSAGLSAADLRTIYGGLCQYVESMLLRHRSVVIPNFCNFVVQKHVGHSGTWGARVSWVPVMMLLPAFCQAYSVASNAQTSLTHMGATTADTINSSAVMTFCGNSVSRHAVMNAVKDMVREIGSLVAAGRTPLVVDMKFCSFTFEGRRVSNVSWQPAFVRALNASSAAESTSGAASSAATSSARATGTAAQPITPRGNILEAAGSSLKVPRPPSVQEQRPSVPVDHDPAAALPSRPSSSRVPAPPQRGSVAPARPAPFAASMASDFSASGGGAVSPRRAANDAHLAAELAVIDASATSAHRKSIARKVAYRRSRNQAFEEAWQKSLQEKRRAAEAEAAVDRATADLAVARVVADAERARQERTERRSEAQQIQKANLGLSELRRGQGIPRVLPSGDIFDARAHTSKIAHDTAALEAQIAQRLSQREREKADDAAYGRAAHQDFVQHAVDEQRRKQDARTERQLAMQEHAQIAAEKKTRARAEREADDDLTRRCTGFQGFGLEGDVFKAQSVAIQKANYEMVQQRARERSEREETDKQRLADAVKRLEARDAALRAQEQRVKSARQHQMRATWTAQMSESRDRRRMDEHDRKTWRDINFLRNESSDDEDMADSHRVLRVPNDRRAFQNRASSAVSSARSGVSASPRR
jgi:hypothetical protein